MVEAKPDYEMVKNIFQAIKNSNIDLPGSNDDNKLAYELYNFIVGFPDILEKNVSRAMTMVLRKGGPGLSKRDWKRLKDHLVASLGG